MTKKQYKLRFCTVNGNLINVIEDEDKIYTLKEIVDILNQSKEKNEQLKKEKERYKLLSEIRDEEINNRILTIKEFISNCSDDIVKNELENLFYSEVNDYDLAKENRKLKKQLQNIKEYIDNSIKRNKEAIEWGKNTDADVGAMGFYTHMLEKMKKDWFE